MFCIFCMNHLPAGTRVCLCGEYKGLMTVQDAEAYLGESLDDTDE